MASTCLDSTLLLNSGTSQAQRQLEALLAAYVSVDERTDYSSLILFAKKYGAYLNFYSLNNTITGDWQNIMGKDVAVTIATVGIWNNGDYTTYLNNLYDYIAAPDAVYTDPKVSLRYLFDFIASIAAEINDALMALPSDLDYRNFLAVSIGSKLAVPLTQLINYYKLYNPTTPPQYIDTGNTTDPRMPVSNVTFFASLLSPAFFSDPSWTPTAGVPVDIITLPVSTAILVSPQAQIVKSSLFKNIVSAFLNGADYIVTQTEQVYIKATLENYSNHAPQYALFLAFLRLFRKVQDQLNHYTERHLEFYYKKVLQLSNATGVPDIVHLVLQLQKNTPAYLLAKGTQLKAGKDTAGNDLFYALTDDIVLNQSSVSLLKSLFLSKGKSPALPQLLYASPKANTSDGQGGKLTSPDQSWFPFGDLTNKTFTAGGATLGFAIASHLLYLNEGTRIITLTFNCASPIDAATSAVLNMISASALSIQFTGNKKWFDAADFKPDTAPNIITIGTSSSQALQFTIPLSGSAPPVVPYSQKIHSGSYPQALPMVKIQLDVQSGFQYYAALKSLVISSITIDVNVTNVQNLVLQNKDGKIDPSKPFKPFGEYPPDNAPFIVGSKEIFQKKLISASVNLIWQTPPVMTIPQQSALSSQLSLGVEKAQETLLSPNIEMETVKATDELKVEKASTGSKKVKDTAAALLTQTQAETINTNQFILIGGQWKKGGTEFDMAQKTSPSITNLVNAYDNGKAISPVDFSANAAYNITAVNGFVQFQLDDSEYDIANFITGSKQVSVNQLAATANADGSTTTTYTVSSTPAMPPVMPFISGIYMNYEANGSLPLDGTQAAPDVFDERQYFFYHIEPFGFREMHPYLANQVPETDKPDVMNLVPIFNLDDSNDKDNGGELWIGLANTLPAETQSILFQVSEGTANPLKNTTEVDWYYMAVNNWIKFDSPIDYTDNLSQSGLVVLNLQGDETTNNTRADAGLLWIKAVAGANTDSVCKIIAVLANAARAQFVQTSVNTFKAIIPQKTISKLAIANGAIKQIDQPYPSSGGKPVETNTQFKQRVSERLRHKNRAVTSWDYERLVLQNFPQIHKVKCLNHTTKNTKKQEYSELKQGTVMVITVPDLSLLTGSNPLLPFTNIGLLDNIKKYLRQLTSPFVHLEVCNPQFEGVELEFCVTFINNNANSNYYTGVLNEDIGKFLMPWAYGSQEQDIEFGGKIEKSALLNFVQKRPYVDHVTGFKMNQYIYGENGDTKFSLYAKNVEEAITSTARSILVPYSDPVLGVSNNITSSENCNCNG